jgi:hypothetical protein
MSRAGRYLGDWLGGADHWRWCGAGDRVVGVLWCVGVVVDDPRRLIGGLGWLGEEVVEAPGEVAFEAAERVFLGLAFGLFAR